MGKKNHNSSKEQIDYLKKVSEDLESMILGTEIPNLKETQKGVELPPISNIKPLDYDAIKSFADEKAESIVESVVLMYLPKELVAQHDYVAQKMFIDKLTMSNLIFQMKTAEHAIKKLMEEIDSGSIRDRSFEVLASLQKSKMEIVKHMAQFMIVLENNYKSLKLDYESNKAENVTSDSNLEIAEEAESLKFRGTKDLMSKIQGFIQDSSKPKPEGFEEVLK